MKKYNTSDGRIYLGYLRYIFEPRYGRKLSDKEAEKIADNLIAFGKVIEEFYRKKKKIHGKNFDKWVQKNIIEEGIEPK